METKTHSNPICSDRFCAGYGCKCSCHNPQELMRAEREYIAAAHREAVAARRKRREGKHG